MSVLSWLCTWTTKIGGCAAETGEKRDAGPQAMMATTGNGGAANWYERSWYARLAQERCRSGLSKRVSGQCSDTGNTGDTGTQATWATRKDLNVGYR